MKARVILPRMVHHLPTTMLPSTEQMNFHSHDELTGGGDAKVKFGDEVDANGDSLPDGDAARSMVFYQPRPP